MTKNTGTLAPSHMRVARAAKRRSGGVVITTYAAAMPAETRIALAIVRAVAGVTRHPRAGPVGPVPECVPLVLGAPKLDTDEPDVGVDDEPVASRT